MKVDLNHKNRARLFQSTTNLESGLSNFHKILVNVMRVNYKRQK